jgi:hypothetical protein
MGSWVGWQVACLHRDDPDGSNLIIDDGRVGDLVVGGEASQGLLLKTVRAHSWPVRSLTGVIVLRHVGRCRCNHLVHFDDTLGDEAVYVIWTSLEVRHVGVSSWTS